MESVADGIGREIVNRIRSVEDTVRLPFPSQYKSNGEDLRPRRRHVNTVILSFALPVTTLTGDFRSTDARDHRPRSDVRDEKCDR